MLRRVVGGRSAGRCWCTGLCVCARLHVCACKCMCACVCARARVGVVCTGGCVGAVRACVCMRTCLCVCARKGAWVRGCVHICVCAWGRDVARGVDASLSCARACVAGRGGARLTWCGDCTCVCACVTGSSVCLSVCLSVCARACVRVRVRGGCGPAPAQTAISNEIIAQMSAQDAESVRREADLRLERDRVAQQLEQVGQRGGETERQREERGVGAGRSGWSVVAWAHTHARAHIHI